MPFLPMSSTYSMLGRPVTGKMVIWELEEPHYLKLEMATGIQGAQEWRLTATPDETTLVRCTIDYTVPGVVLGRLADLLFIERQNERQMRNNLANLKALAEHEHGGPQTHWVQSGEAQAFQILRDHLGSQWVGEQANGRDEMVRTLQKHMAYDKRQATAMVDKLIHMGRLRYEQAGTEPPAEKDPAARFQALSIGVAMTRGVGHWQIGSEYE